MTKILIVTVLVNLCWFQENLGCDHLSKALLQWSVMPVAVINLVLNWTPAIFFLINYVQCKVFTQAEETERLSEIASTKPLATYVDFIHVFHNSSYGIPNMCIWDQLSDPFLQSRSQLLFIQFPYCAFDFWAFFPLKCGSGSSQHSSNDLLSSIWSH